MDEREDVDTDPGVRLRCDQCGFDIIPVDGVTAIWSRGYWWCAKHCRFFYSEGVPVVDFPSDGKLIPSTLLMNRDE